MQYSFLVLISTLLLLCVGCQPTEISTPTILPALTSTATPVGKVQESAPADAALDIACRVTINLFLRYKSGDDFQAFRNLFVTDSQYLADSYKPPQEERLLLELMPASAQWRRDFPDRPIPITFHEYAYYVKVTLLSVESQAAPAYQEPGYTIMYMAIDGPLSCKIRGMGKG